MDGFVPKDTEFMSSERGFLVNRGEKWKRVKMKTKWEEMRLMRPHAYMHTETEVFRPQQDGGGIFQQLFTVSQMRLTVQCANYTRSVWWIGFKGPIWLLFTHVRCTAGGWMTCKSGWFKEANVFLAIFVLLFASEHKMNVTTPDARLEIQTSTHLNS